MTQPNHKSPSGFTPDDLDTEKKTSGLEPEDSGSMTTQRTIKGNGIALSAVQPLLTPPQLLSLVQSALPSLLITMKQGQEIQADGTIIQTYDLCVESITEKKVVARLNSTWQQIPVRGVETKERDEIA